MTGRRRPATPTADARRTGGSTRAAAKSGVPPRTTGSAGTAPREAGKSGADVESAAGDNHGTGSPRAGRSSTAAKSGGSPRTAGKSRAATRTPHPGAGAAGGAARARTRAKAQDSAGAAAAELTPVAADAATAAGPQHPATLAIDIGGTGLKANVLDANGRLLAARVRVATTYPCPPELMVDELVKLVKPLPMADRASAGFPGVVRKGLVLTAPHFVTRSGPGSPVVDELARKWKGFDLGNALADRLRIPVRIANDADLQGWAVVSGSGLEMVVTLGTGVGSALFLDGKLAPHLELAHHPFRKNQTYNEQIGEAALLKVGPRKWRKRVLEALANFQSLVNYDRLYLGGGNGRRMAGHVDPSITIVDNVAGILGGIKLWEVGSHGGA
jgi:polyphosphate glucokinase